MTEKYYGTFTDREDPGYHLVGIEDLEGGTSRELIQVPTLELDDRRLVIVYRVVADGLSDEAAQALILDVLLNEYYQHDYDADADEILFVNKHTGERYVVPFP